MQGFSTGWVVPVRKEERGGCCEVQRKHLFENTDCYLFKKKTTKSIKLASLEFLKNY